MLVAEVGIGSVVKQPTDALRSPVVGRDPKSVAAEQLIDGVDGGLGADELVDH
ncbi:MAG TPA: hypothetical protein VG325_18705 [Solirubrobacteraceae bacterium]|nr:hypothetical protein [Solirubrobacteraceae bacterium]